MSNIYKRISSVTNGFVIAASMLFVACVGEDAPCDPVAPDDGITIEFRMATRNAKGSNQSRAVLPPSGTPEDGFPNENFLDLDNLRFLLFNSDWSLIQIFKPEIEAEDAQTYIKYRVRAFLNNPYFLDAEDGTEITFGIMVLGNCSTLSPERLVYHDGMTLADVFDPSTVGTFAMPVRSNYGNFWRPSFTTADYTDADGIVHSGVQRAYIPMSGMQTFTVKVDDLKASTPQNPLQLSGIDGEKDINMLRALAKIEVIDRINATGTGAETVQPGITERTNVEKAELMGFMSRGSILPSMSDWNRPVRDVYETQYSTSPLIPVGSAFKSVPLLGDGSLEVNGDYSGVVNFFADAEATKSRADGCRVLSCYLTEYNPADIADNLNKMWVRLTVLNNGDSENSQFYRLSLAPYTNGAPGAVMPIVRNNIYRYEITSVTSEISVNWTVCPMDEYGTDIEFN